MYVYMYKDNTETRRSEATIQSRVAWERKNI